MRIRLSVQQTLSKAMYNNYPAKLNEYQVGNLFNQDSKMQTLINTYYFCDTFATTSSQILPYKLI